MPWKESSIVDERIKFISAVIEGVWSITALCQMYNISRTTAYKRFTLSYFFHFNKKRSLAGCLLSGLQIFTLRTSVV